MSLVFVSLVIILANVFTYAQEVTSAGALTYSYPLNLPAGRNGVAPNLSLVYNSNAGNGMLGVGWSLGGLSIITRDSSYPVTFNDSTDHFLLDGQKLVLGSDGYYHTEKESYVRIELTNSGSSNYYWIVTLKNGTKMYYGLDDDDHDSTNDGYVKAVGITGGKALVWCLSRAEDVNGNYYIVRYSEDDTNGDYYPLNIEWTKPNATAGFSHTVEFFYDSDTSGNAARTDHGPLYIPTKLDLDERMKWIVVKTGGSTKQLVRKYRIDYSYGTSTKRSKIDSITEYGNNGTSWPTYDSPTSLRVARNYTPDGSALPPVKFKYDDFLDGILFNNYPYSSYPYSTNEQVVSGDFNGDGKIDLFVWDNLNSDRSVFKSIDGATFQRISLSKTSPIEDYNLLAEDCIVPGDFDGDGKTDLFVWDSNSEFRSVFISDGNGNFIRKNYSTEIPDEDDPFPACEGFQLLSNEKVLSGDFNGDGKTDLFVWNFDNYIRAVFLSNGDGTFERIGFLQTTPIDGYSLSAAEHIITGDFDGNGRTDLFVWDHVNSYRSVFLSNGDGTFAKKGFSQTTPIDGYSLSPAEHVIPGDFNGDGKTDLFIWDHSNYYRSVFISRGDGTFDRKGFSQTTPIDGYSLSTAEHIITGDFDGDGRTDLFVWDHLNYIRSIFLAIGDGKFIRLNFSSSSPLDGHTLNISEKLLINDYNGDGKSDIRVGSVSSTSKEVFISTENRIDLLTTITLPTGGTVNVTYEPAPQVPGAVVPNASNTIIADSSPRNLVTKIEIDDRISHGSANTIVTEYEYYNHLKTTGYPHERTDLGFGWIKKIDKSGDTATNESFGAYTKTYYNQVQPFEGLVDKVETYDRDNTLYSKSEYKYNVRTDNTTPPYDQIKFIYKTSEYSYNYNGESGDPVTYRVRYCEDPGNPDASFYDAKGNLKIVKNDGEWNSNALYDVVADNSIITTEWISNTGQTIWVPSHIKKQACKLGETELSDASEQWFEYDNGTVIKGLLRKKEIREKPDPSTDKITLKYGYDSYGNLDWFKDGRMSNGTANTVAFEYDDYYKTYLETETNYVNESLSFVSSIQYNDLMWPTQVTDANSKIWKTKYDVFGRVEQQASPNDNINDLQNLPTKQYVYSDPVKDSNGIITSPGKIESIIKQSQTLQETHRISSHSYYDGLGRIIQTKTPTETANTWATIDYFYDASGRNYKTSVPYPVVSSPAAYTTPDTSQKYVETEYDKISRAIKTINTDGTFSRTVYEKKRVVSIDERGYASSKEVNGNAVTEKSYEGSFTDPTYPDSSIPAYYWVQTQAAWDGVRITDSTTGTTGYAITTACDMLGRKSSYTDPNMGTWSYTYDKNGNLETQIDGNNQNKSTEEKKSLVFEYDNLNRIHYKKLKTGTAEPVTQVEYIYDNGGVGVTNDIGRLVRVNYGNSSEAYTYDERGRVVSITMNVDGNVKTFSYTYNSADQLVTETYPTGEVLTYHYDSAGQLDSVTSSLGVTYASNIGYTTLNKLKSITYGNNVKTTYDYYDDLDINGNPLSEEDGGRHNSYRLKSISIINQNDNDKNLGNTTYQYDQADNIISKAFTQDYGNDYAESFTYDHVNRLATAASDLYAAKSYFYTPNNNFNYKISWDDSSNRMCYTYDANKPHAVKEIKNQAGTVTYYSFEYDENGNMTNMTGYSTVTIHAKRAGSSYPMMLLMSGTTTLMQWTVSNDEYHTFTWNGLLKPNSIMQIAVGTDLLVDKITVNGVSILNIETLVTSTSPWTYDTTGMGTPSRDIDYNADNKVISITQNGSTSYFSYDYSGARIKKTEPVNGISTTTYYFGAKYEEESANGVTKKTSYYFQNGQRIAQRTQITGQTDEVLYYHTDHLGSAVRLTDSVGTPVQSIAYAPFGETVYYWGIKDPSYQFTGQELDAPSGLYYYGARYYCPEIGRFIQPDTILDGLNRYAYCWNNPMNYVDPTGMYTDYSHGAPVFYREVQNTTDTSTTDTNHISDTTYALDAKKNSYMNTVSKSSSSSNNGPKQSDGSESAKPGTANSGTSGDVISFKPDLTNPYGEDGKADWAAPEKEDLTPWWMKPPSDDGSDTPSSPSSPGNIEVKASLVAGQPGWPTWAQNIDTSISRFQGWFSGYGPGEWVETWEGKLSGRTSLVPMTEYGVWPASDRLRQQTIIMGVIAIELLTPSSLQTYSYSPRVRARAVEDPVSHNFPFSYDSEILATRPMRMDNGYKIYQKAGTMNGKGGVFEIGVKDLVIDHRFFRPHY